MHDLFRQGCLALFQQVVNRRDAGAAFATAHKVTAPCCGRPTNARWCRQQMNLSFSALSASTQPAWCVRGRALVTPKNGLAKSPFFCFGERTVF